MHRNPAHMTDPELRAEQITCRRQAERTQAAGRINDRDQWAARWNRATDERVRRVRAR